jgi:hypothetical protein
MLILSTDSNKLQEAKRGGSLEDAVRALPDYIKLLLPQHLLNKVLLFYRPRLRIVSLTHQPQLGPRGGLWPVLFMCNP